MNARAADAHGRWVWLTLAACAVAAGAWLRLHDLGAPNIIDDE